MLSVFEVVLSSVRISVIWQPYKEHSEMVSFQASSNDEIGVDDDYSCKLTFINESM